MNAPIASPFLDLPEIPLRDFEPEIILECVCKAYQMNRDMLTQERRTARLVEARQVAVWLLATRLRWNAQQIGELLNRDQSAMRFALRRVNMLRLKDPKLDRFMDRIALAVDARLA